MVCSLRYAVRKLFGNIKYLHYYRRMISDYENGNWHFDVRTLVKNIKVDIPCPKYVCKRGFVKRLCFTVFSFENFETEFKKYMYEYIHPLQEIRKNKILARKIWVKKYGFISKGSQYCSKAMYNCKICINQKACEVSKKYTKDDLVMIKMTKMLELLYGNLNNNYWNEFVSGC